MDDLVKQTIQTNVHNTLNALDCVSRQYALGHYQYVCRRTNCKECPLHIKATDMGDTFTDCELELFLYNLPSVQPEPRWIPVTEQTLPRENSTVVAIGKTATWDVGNYRGHAESNIHRWNWKKNTMKDVYWWMYKKDALPQPFERSEK